MFEKIRTKRLCRIVSKEIEGKGYCAWTITGSSLYNVGVTLPDDIKQSAEEQNKFRNTLAELREKYKKAIIVSTEPIFSAGGVYASYLSVHRA
jgi:hypothetical protein